MNEFSKAPCATPMFLAARRLLDCLAHVKGRDSRRGLRVLDPTFGHPSPSYPKPKPHEPM
ncbi:hypothetical protein E5D57_004962 [Metarhizium anisopliae]|nr:hypothetical protein E5D57_004962 [Metarhizium anisopliae]